MRIIPEAHYVAKSVKKIAKFFDQLQENIVKFVD